VHNCTSERGGRERRERRRSHSYIGIITSYQTISKNIKLSHTKKSNYNLFSRSVSRRERGRGLPQQVQGNTFAILQLPLQGQLQIYTLSNFIITATTGSPIRKSSLFLFLYLLH
jgi:hypothetical protein